MSPQRIALVLFATLLVAGRTAGAQSPPRGDAAHGKQTYVRYGCYQCHGYQGQGSNAGPKLAPNPFPYVAYASQLRQPRGRMPAYTGKTMSDQELADVYAYLLTIPKARAVADIPLLSGIR